MVREWKTPSTRPQIPNQTNPPNLMTIFVCIYPKAFRGILLNKLGMDAPSKKTK